MDGLRNDYNYDDLNRIDWIKQSGANVSAKRVDDAFDAAGRLGTVKRFADTTGTLLVTMADYGFDDADRLTSLAHTGELGQSLAGYTWKYDALNRLTNSTSTQDGDATFGYYQTDQLTSATYAASTSQPTAPPAESYSYDENGNRANSGYVTQDNNQTVSHGHVR